MEQEPKIRVGWDLIRLFNSVIRRNTIELSFSRTGEETDKATKSYEAVKVFGEGSSEILRAPKVSSAGTRIQLDLSYKRGVYCKNNFFRIIKLTII